MTTPKDSTKTADVKRQRAALRLMRRGRMTMAEVALLAKTSRQRVAYWAKIGEVDAVKTRAEYIGKLWQWEIDRDL